MTLALATAAAACGRLNFEAVGGSSSDPDGSIDGDAPHDTNLGPDLCPTAQTLLLDDFNDGTISIGPMGTWAGTFTSAVTVAENGGRLVVTFPTGAATNAHAGVFSSRMNLANVCALVAAPVLPAANTAAYAYLTIEEPQGANRSRITIAIGAGTLEIRKETGGALQIVDTRPYDPTKHAWWRLRTGAVVAWETSGDMLAWETLHQEVKYFDLANTQVVVGAGSDLTSTNAGTAQFDTARIFAP